jgi:hypothetical protein
MGSLPAMETIFKKDLALTDVVPGVCDTFSLGSPKEHYRLLAIQLLAKPYQCNPCMHVLCPSCTATTYLVELS